MRAWGLKPIKLKPSTLNPKPITAPAFQGAPTARGGWGLRPSLEDQEPQPQGLGFRVKDFGFRV